MTSLKSESSLLHNSPTRLPKSKLDNDSVFYHHWIGLKSQEIIDSRFIKFLDPGSNDLDDRLI